MTLRRRLTLTLAVLALVSSALAVRAPAPAVAEDPITFGQPVRMPMTGHLLLSGASEPSIALDADGTVYVTAACCLPVSAPAWYSKDGGKTFDLMRSPGGLRESTVGAEGDFVVDDADRPILADTRVPSIVVSRWRDHGDTWERSLDATEVTAPLQDRPWLAWGGGALYLYVNGGLQNTYVYQSYDEGVTWNPIAVGSFSGNFPTHMTVNRQDGAIWLVGRNGFTAPGIFSHVSTDGGATWTRGDVAFASRGAVSPTTGLAVSTDEAGNGYAAWSTFDNGGCDIEMAVSTDHGETWRGPYKVNRDPGCSTFAWIDAGLPGRAVVTWYQSPQGVNQAQQSATSQWRLRAAVTTDALSEAPTFQEAELGTHVIDLGSLTTGYGQAGGATRSLLDFFEVATGPDGRFHISYARNNGTNGTDETWYVQQASGPLLRANRIAEATSVAISETAIEGDTLSVRGASEFKRAPTVRLYEGFDDDPRNFTGGEVTRVGPDSDELLVTAFTPPNGVASYDGLPTGIVVWDLEVGGEDHRLEVFSRDTDGPHFYLDGEPIAGTIDAETKRAIARVSLSAIGAEPGDAITFDHPQPTGLVTPPTKTYVVPEATVTLSLRQGGVEVASSEGALDPVYASWDGTLDLAGLEAGEYELAATACYAGACATSTEILEL